MGIFSSLGGWLGPRTPLDDALRHAVDRAVETVDPRLKTVSGYQRKLAPAVSHALDYCARLAAEIPGPVVISPRAFGADPLVHAMFAAPGDIGEMLGKSRELREFLADPAQRAGDELYALLGMRQREKAVIGMALRGEMLQNDVPQRLLYFADHTLGELANRHETTRQRLQATAFDSLAQGFASAVAQLRQERADALTAWTAARAAASVARRRLLETRQRQTLAALTPERLLAAYAEWLAAPEGRLYLKATEMKVDRMGVVAGDAAAGDDFSTLSFPVLVGRDHRHWIVVVVRISRADAQEALRRQQEASRYLII